MMNSISNKMLRVFSEDAGSPELRTPELGKLGRRGRRHISRRMDRSQASPAMFAWMSYEQLKRV